MATDKIRLTSAKGKTIPFTIAKIKSALIGRNAGIPEFWGETHVWAEDPLMVCLCKVRNTKRGPFHYEVTETDEDSRGKLVDIVHIEFKEDELDEAIEIFMELCQKPKKNHQRKLVKKMGGHAIFINKIATDCHLG